MPNDMYKPFYTQQAPEITAVIATIKQRFNPIAIYEIGHKGHGHSITSIFASSEKITQ
jgi:hypothetical protein